MSNVHVSGDATGNDFVSRETHADHREQMAEIFYTLEIDYAEGFAMCEQLACGCRSREMRCPMRGASFVCPFQMRGCSTVTAEHWEIFIFGYGHGMNHAYAVSGGDLVSCETQEKEKGE